MQRLNMDIDFITVCLSFIIGLLMLWLFTRRPKGLPPGPFRLPFLGNLLSTGPDGRILSRKLRKQYGDICSIYIFNTPIIFLSGHDTIKDALVKHADVFSDRPHSFLTDTLSKDKGVVSTSGAVWKEQRKFALTTLRDLGMGKSVIEDKIQEELVVFLQALSEDNSQPQDISPILQNAVSNIICSLVFGKRFEYTDPLFRRFLRALQENFEDLRLANTLDALPILKYLPGDMFRFKRVISNKRLIDEELSKPIIKAQMEEAVTSRSDNFISAYLEEMQKRQNQGEKTSMDIENLIQQIADLFAAGTETTSTTIRWAIAFFLNYPEVQEKCFQEIKENIGLNRPPSMKDKTSLPYVEATILEILRYGQIAPRSVPHAVSEDVQFRGFTFPKGITVVPMLFSVLEDPDIWGDPENFRPERFLDDDGKVKKVDGFVPFSLGRRVCLGESLARMELFLFLVSMIQRFRFQCDSGKPSLEGVTGITISPKPYLVKCFQRF